MSRKLETNGVEAEKRSQPADVAQLDFGDPCAEAEQIHVDWWEEPTPLVLAWVGVVLAGGALPDVYLLAMRMAGSSPYTVANLESFLMLSIGSVVLFVAGALFTICGSVPAAIVLLLFRFATGWRLTDRGACGVLGGLTGFLCAASFIPTWLSIEGFSIPVFFVVALVVLGHFAGILGCYYHRRNMTWWRDPFFAKNKSVRLKHIFGVTLLLALLAFCCNAAGETGACFAVFSAGYFVLQLLLLALEHLSRIHIGGAETISE